jgi:site-specific recombinase XerC
MTRKRSKGRIGIPNLFPVELAGGVIKYHWKPTPRMRRAGWANLDCGTDRATAIQLAEARNAEIATWDAGLNHAGLGHNSGPSLSDMRPRSMRELADAWMRSDHFRNTLAPKTQRLYKHSADKLMIWTEQGSIPVAHISRAACLELRDHLVRSGQKSATANTLRVLRVLMAYAVDRGIIAVNPALKMRIPESDRRTHIIDARAIDLLDRAATALHLPSVRLAMLIGFWTMQRESDLLAYTKADWRIIPAVDVPPEARSALSDAHGNVWGFKKAQQKTKLHVWPSVPPAVRDLVHTTIKANEARDVPTFVILPDDRMAKRYSDKQFQRRFSQVRIVAWYGAILAGDWRLAKHIRKTQFRDFRRTGMCYFGELRVPVPLIAAISGHSINYTQKIIDTYMPANNRFAVMGLAEAITRAAERTVIEERLEG